MRRLASVVLALAAALPQAGCLLGPRYERPETPEPDAWHTPLGDSLSSAAADRAALATWWTVLGDPLLSDLVSRAVAGNLDIEAARERVKQARERRKLAEAGLFPTVRARLTLAPARQSHSSSRQATGLEALWALDPFGKLRRGSEAAQRDGEASEEQLHDAQVEIAAEVVQGYVDLRELQAQLAVADTRLSDEAETAALARWRAQAGLVGELDALRADTDAAQTRAQLPTLSAGVEEAMNRLALLLAETPGALAQQLEAPQPIPAAPAAVAVGVPADALRQRPDVRRAERQLAAETARIGVAKASAWPSISLSGAVGAGVIGPATFTSPQSIGAAAAAEAVQTIFDHGAIHATIKGQKAVRSEALAHFRSTVLAALDDVENAIAEYREEQTRQRGLDAAHESARGAAELAQQRYAAGLADFQAVLDAQRSLHAVDEERVRSEARVVGDLVRLYRALGGGWNAEA